MSITSSIVAGEDLADDAPLPTINPMLSPRTGERGRALSQTQVRQPPSSSITRCRHVG